MLNLIKITKKVNKDTRKTEYSYKEVNDINVHSSVLDVTSFKEVYAREISKARYARLIVKDFNEGCTNDEVSEMTILQEYYKFPVIANKKDLLILSTSFDGLNKELINLMCATLMVHGALFEVNKDKNGDYFYKKIVLPIPTLKDFYTKSKDIIPQIETGATTLEEAVNVIKPLYNDCTNIINHDAVKDVCKKWVESTKEKNTRLFITGLFNSWKVTRSNRIKGDSPLKSFETFQNYVLMWLVTEGTMQTKQNKPAKDTYTWESFVNNKTK